MRKDPSRFHDESFSCDYCSLTFEDDDIINWKCRKCNRPISIQATPEGQSRQTFIRALPEEIEEGHYVFLYGTSPQGGNKILSKREGKKEIFLSLEGYRRVGVDRERYINCVK